VLWQHTYHVVLRLASGFSREHKYLRDIIYSECNADLSDLISLLISTNLDIKNWLVIYVELHWLHFVLSA